MAEKLFGKTKEELLQRNIRELPSKNLNELENKIATAFDSGRKHVQIENLSYLKGHKEIPISISLSKISDKRKDSIGYLLIVKDNTNQRNKELQELKLILSAVEKERERLSHDLHDSLGQTLIASQLQIRELKFINPDSSEYGRKINSCIGILDNCINSIREICFNLMPKNLQDGGLKNACDDLIAIIRLNCIVDYNFPDYALKISKENEKLFFRIIQEFITNSLKHSKCKKITFKVQKNKNSVILKLSDDGIGFDFQQVKKGFGLNNIKSRLETLKVKYKYSSFVKKGTFLELWLS